MKDQLLTVKNLSKQYLKTISSGVEEINFNILRGNIVAIIGESGSGKSTLLKCMYGLLKPDSGEIYFEGKRVKGPDEQLIPGHPEMKMVTQDFSLNIYAKVYDNIASMLSNTNLEAKKNNTIEMMERLHISKLREKKIVELSGGEQQRVAIAKALISETKLLLLDEPFSQVDATLKNELRAAIKTLAKEQGKTIVLVSHDPTDGLFLADQLLILKDGTLVEFDEPRKIYENPSSSYTAQLLGNAVVLQAKEAEQFGIHTSKTEIVFYPEWVQIDTGPSNLVCEVIEVWYKGFYEELLLERNGVRIRAIEHLGRYKKSDQVEVNLSRFLEF